jgi:nitronate monooxygenase
MARSSAGSSPAKPARVLANRYVDAAEDALDFPLQRSLAGPLGQAAAAQGSGDFMPLYAGQGAGLWREMPASALLELLVAETERAWAGG